MPAFLERYPAVTPDWSLDNRPQDLIAGGFDAAIGGGFDLPLGMVARELARLQIVAVASPSFMRGKRRPRDPAGLGAFPCVAMRSPSTSRVRTLIMRNGAGAEMAAVQNPVIVLDDPSAMCHAVLLGMGIGLMAVPHALPHLESGTLVQLLPGWYCDVGPLSLYFASQKLLPGKTSRRASASTNWRIVSPPQIYPNEYPNERQNESPEKLPEIKPAPTGLNSIRGVTPRQRGRVTHLARQIATSKVHGHNGLHTGAEQEHGRRHRRRIPGQCFHQENACAERRETSITFWRNFCPSRRWCWWPPVSFITTASAPKCGGCGHHDVLPRARTGASFLRRKFTQMSTQMSAKTSRRKSCRKSSRLRPD